MNQVNNIINVNLEKRDGKDYMVFGFENKLDVCLNDESGQSALKTVFSALLKELIKAPIILEYTEKTDYKVNLYIDVCKEYIKELNNEIVKVRENMPKSLKDINLM